MTEAARRTDDELRALTDYQGNEALWALVLADAQQHQPPPDVDYVLQNEPVTLKGSTAAALLDAQPTEDRTVERGAAIGIVVALLLPVFEYRTDILRYTVDGGLVARETVRAASNAFAQQAVIDMEEATLSLIRQEISADEWADLMDDAIRRNGVRQGTAAAGGWQRVTPQNRASIGQWVEGQYRYRRGLADRMASGYYGDDLLSNGLLRDVRSYGGQGRGLYEEEQARHNMEELGHDEVRNILGIADHCEPGDRPSCLQIHALGWVRPTDSRWRWPCNRQCLGFCHCGAKTRKGSTD